MKNPKTPAEMRAAPPSDHPIFDIIGVTVFMLLLDILHVVSTPRHGIVPHGPQWARGPFSYGSEYGPAPGTHSRPGLEFVTGPRLRFVSNVGRLNCRPEA
jgi:hypothetical protein